LTEDLLDRLAALPNLSDVPREELEWLAARGRLEVYEPGDVVAGMAERVERLMIVLDGHIAISVDRGVGPRRVMAWRTGEVTGKLPYSRMISPPGDNYAHERTEALVIHENNFSEMVRDCPVFTAHTVHLMLDRARSFSASDLQDEKMISLGRLAAGLAHELNNPASAAVRGAKLLLEGLADAEAASRALGTAGLTASQMGAIDALRTSCQAKPTGGVLSPLQQAEREERILDWLEGHGADPDHTTALADTPVGIDELDSLAAELNERTLDTALRWIAAGCSTHSLVADIENAATRIHDLVAAIKKFTYMDNRGGEESVDVESGLRDTVRVIASKAKSKGASVSLDIDAGLPPVKASGGELNQVWLNLIDNALDAVSESGTVEVGARQELDRVVVTVADDGPGIPEEVMPRIFDAFFTTKPPGQGTGLGLELARRLVRRYHGDISVQSRPGRTSFHVSLEVVDPAEGVVPLTSGG
jgi:signal transduction histidine kinase